MGRSHHRHAVSAGVTKAVIDQLHVRRRTRRRNTGSTGPPIPQLPPARRLGPVGMASAQVVVRRAVVSPEVIKPHLPLVVRKRQGGVGRLTTPGTGATTTHALERIALMTEGRGPMEYERPGCRCLHSPVYP